MAVHKKEKGLSQNSSKSSHSNNDNKVKQATGKNSKPNDKVNGYNIGHTILVIVIGIPLLFLILHVKFKNYIMIHLNCFYSRFICLDS